MSVASRGTKHRCPHCGAAFYDLGRDPIVCPKCQTPYVETSKMPVRASHRPRPVAPAPAVEAEEEEAAAFDEDEVMEHDEDEAGDTLPDEHNEQDED
ncbi:MAG TPA: TIGR02300 family protein [Magnetospirillum sp.]|nr:TIGR02300 family protein [Magnetospirillum sp.]